MRRWTKSKDNNTRKLCERFGIEIDCGDIMDNYKSAPLSELVGKTVSTLGYSNHLVVFDCADGSRYLMFHYHECCEDVELEDICGEMGFLVGSPITMAEKSSNEGRHEHGDFVEEWTFYKFATLNGYVTLRWYGTSNGYYGTGVSFVRWIGKRNSHAN